MRTPFSAFYFRPAGAIRGSTRHSVPDPGRRSSPDRAAVCGAEAALRPTWSNGPTPGRWSSLWHRLRGDQSGLLDEGPVAMSRSWRNTCNLRRPKRNWRRCGGPWCAAHRLARRRGRNERRGDWGCNRRCVRVVGPRNHRARKPEAKQRFPTLYSLFLAAGAFTGVHGTIHGPLTGESRRAAKGPSLSRAGFARRTTRGILRLPAGNAAGE